MAKRAFAIASHPDDIEFMMAGTLIRLKELGYEIHYITDGAGRKYEFTYNNGLLSSIIYRSRSTTENF